MFETAIKSTGSATSFVGGNNGSELTFGVSEDLGSGLKAMASQTFIYSLTQGSTDNGPGAAAASAGAASTSNASTGSVNSYNSYVGLSSADAGSLKIGQQFSNTFLTSLTGDVFGRAGWGSPAGGAQGQVANSLNYSSPSISGVSVSYQQGLDSSASYTSYSLSYSAGALSAGFASGKSGSTTENILAVNYDFGMAKLFAGSSTATGATDASTVGVSVPFGALSVAAATSKISSAATTNPGATQTTYGVTYNFSKRTSAYLVNTDTTSSAPENYIGIRHNF